MRVTDTNKFQFYVNACCQQSVTQYCDLLSTRIMRNASTFYFNFKCKMVLLLERYCKKQARYLKEIFK